MRYLPVVKVYQGESSTYISLSWGKVDISSSIQIWGSSAAATNRRTPLSLGMPHLFHGHKSLKCPPDETPPFRCRPAPSISHWIDRPAPLTFSKTQPTRGNHRDFPSTNAGSVFISLWKAICRSIYSDFLGSILKCFFVGKCHQRFGIGGFRWCRRAWRLQSLRRCWWSAVWRGVILVAKSGKKNEDDGGETFGFWRGKWMK